MILHISLKDDQWIQMTDVELRGMWESGLLRDEDECYYWIEGMDGTRPLKEYFLHMPMAAPALPQPVTSPLPVAVADAATGPSGNRRRGKLTVLVVGVAVLAGLAVLGSAIITGMAGWAEPQALKEPPAKAAELKEPEEPFELAEVTAPVEKAPLPAPPVKHGAAPPPAPASVHQILQRFVAVESILPRDYGDFRIDRVAAPDATTLEYHFTMSTTPEAPREARLIFRVAMEERDFLTGFGMPELVFEPKHGIVVRCIVRDKDGGVIVTHEVKPSETATRTPEERNEVVDALMEQYAREFLVTDEESEDIRVTAQRYLPGKVMETEVEVSSPAAQFMLKGRGMALLRKDDEARYFGEDGAVFRKNEVIFRTRVVTREGKEVGRYTVGAGSPGGPLQAAENTARESEAEKILRAHAAKTDINGLPPKPLSFKVSEISAPGGGLLEYKMTQPVLAGADLAEARLRMILAVEHPAFFQRDGLPAVFFRPGSDLRLRVRVLDATTGKPVLIHTITPSEILRWTWPQGERRVGELMTRYAKEFEPFDQPGGPRSTSVAWLPDRILEKTIRLRRANHNYGQHAAWEASTKEEYERAYRQPDHDCYRMHRISIRYHVYDQDVRPLGTFLVGPAAGKK
ncbi:hypothetical protein OVA24_16470 [Luteolibacter sp. SL250]|uniref:hypothetical protein n=1 Tax=Luteolibacter sp. SL250 TaxID=2995170 RepID=UPI00226F7C27|nr:hypothetical protein [Luteolibacter sp. SL250]WAC18826.1 hypothetical protein OVA24_16470 [Luteolibacter sp. SL250]